MTTHHRPIPPRLRQQLCSLSASGGSSLCAEARQACFDGEQIFLHSPQAVSDRKKLMNALKGVDLFDIKKPLHSEIHNIVQVAAPDAMFTHVPLAVNAHTALRDAHRRNPNASTFNLSASRFAARRVQPAAPRAFDNTSSALAFITTWSNAWQETFHRAVPRVFEEFCAADDRGIVVIPAAWGSTSTTPEVATSASASTWLAPFSQAPVWPMSLMPSPESEQQQLFGNKPCSRECFRAYLLKSEAYFAKRPPMCFEQLRLCSFQLTPRRARPWSAMQTLAAYYAGIPRTRTYVPHMSAHDGTLRVVFILRATRRKLANVEQLVDACSQWQPQALPELRTHCSALSFSTGLKAAAPVLRRVDVLIGMHGGDLVNGLLQHAGASVLEILPVHRAGCPCDTFRKVFASERGKIFHYTAASRNVSFVRGRDRGMNSDIELPPSVMTAALKRIVEVRGERSQYVYRQFAF